MIQTKSYDEHQPARSPNIVGKRTTISYSKIGTTTRSLWFLAQSIAGFTKQNKREWEKIWSDRLVSQYFQVLYNMYLHNNNTIRPSTKTLIHHEYPS